MFFYVVFIIIISFVYNSESCSCKKPNVSEIYCKADFVAHVKILNILTNGSDEFHATEYEVEFLKVYKKSDKFETVKRKNVVVTPPQGACGVMIDMNSKKSKEWILFGMNSQDDLFINICWPNAPYSSAMNENLEGGELAHADCVAILATTTEEPPTTKPLRTKKPHSTKVTEPQPTEPQPTEPQATEEQTTKRPAKSSGGKAKSKRP